jgi:glycosyltransferase involved in cell wall biosynthesis
MTALGHWRDHEVHRISEETPRWVPGCDVLHIHRHTFDTVQTLARQAKEDGAAVVWDNDDDQGSMPKSVATHKHFSGYSWERRRVEIQRLFRFVDLVTAPSATLAERLAELGAPRVEVVENFIPDQLLDVSRPPHEGVTIGWIAGLEHQMDVERIPIREVLQRLLDEREDVRVMTVGLRLGLKGERYEPRDAVPTTELSRCAAELDIAIAPLADIAFSRARSNIKLKEYAAAGTPWLASPVGPYAGMGEKQGGRLVADDRWHEELTRLIDKPRDRGKLGKRARKWAKGETLSANLDAIEATLRRAIEHARSVAVA